jgi:hypothetical protein
MAPKNAGGVSIGAGFDRRLLEGGDRLPPHDRRKR